MIAKLTFVLCSLLLVRIGSGHHKISTLETTINKFAVDFLKQTSNDGNQFFSPFGIHSAFSMLLLGARGQTENQLKRALHLSWEGKQEAEKAIFQSFPVLRSHLLAGRYNLSMASRLFGSKELKPLKKFEDDSKRYFDADAEHLDFAHHPDESLRAINDWAAEQTRGRIQRVVSKDDIDPNLRLLLLNAIDFKAAWKYSFDRNRTQDAEFYVSSGKTKTVPMMNVQNAKLRHAVLEGLSSSALELPYAGETASMIIVLPNSPEVQLRDVKTNMTAQTLDEATFENEEVILSLPKMKLEASLRLNDLLVRLGVEDVFQPGRSDLSGIDGRKELYVSKALHKASVEVSEEGTEASAVTSVLVKTRKALNLFFIVDRPFLFFIVDKETRLVLFCGQVVDP